MNIAEDSLKIEHSALPPKPLTSKIVSTPIYSAKRRGECIMIRVTAITRLNKMVASTKGQIMSVLSDSAKQGLRGSVLVMRLQTNMADSAHS